jgi:hypothetical protein
MSDHEISFSKDILTPTNDTKWKIKYYNNL